MKKMKAKRLIRRIARRSVSYSNPTKIVVQVQRDNRSKGARSPTDLLPGKYIVLFPNKNKIAILSKIHRAAQSHT